MAELPEGVVVLGEHQAIYGDSVRDFVGYFHKGPDKGKPRRAWKYRDWGDCLHRTVSMAMKRALVGAVIEACRLAGDVTLDLEDFDSTEQAPTPRPPKDPPGPGPRAPDRLCPSCNEKGREVRLQQREGQRGAFWGCPNYPECRYTQDLNAPPALPVTPGAEIGAEPEYEVPW